jgi:hypothetical protein
MIYRVLAIEWTALEILKSDSRGEDFAFDAFPFDELEKMHLAIQVIEKRLRPKIPEHTQPGLANSIRRCWDGDHACRRKMEEVRRELESGSVLFEDTPVDEPQAWVQQKTPAHGSALQPAQDSAGRRDTNTLEKICSLDPLDPIGLKMFGKLLRMDYVFEMELFRDCQGVSHHSEHHQTAQPETKTMKIKIFCCCDPPKWRSLLTRRHSPNRKSGRQKWLFQISISCVDTPQFWEFSLLLEKTHLFRASFEFLERCLFDGNVMFDRDHTVIYRVSDMYVQSRWLLGQSENQA